MKKTIFILSLLATFLAGIIFTGYRSSVQKHKAVQTYLLYANRDLTAVQKPAGAEEWITFKRESESKIHDHKIQITELIIRIKNKEEIFDGLYIKKVAYLDEKIKYIKSRLENYEKGPGNWESFKYGINHDMDAIEKAFVELNADNK